MKKIYSLIITILLSHSLFAAVHTISVANFAFAPNSVTADVGDTILFVWSSGTHTTTSTSVPPLANSWDAPMSSSSPVFAYIIQVEGTYNYVCSFHPSMVGTITAVNTSGIKNVTLAEGFTVSNSINGSNLNVGFTLNRPSSVKISLMDLTGRIAKVLVNGTQISGRFSEAYTVDELQKGIYIVEMIVGSERFTKRILVQ